MNTMINEAVIARQGMNFEQLVMLFIAALILLKVLQSWGSYRKNRKLSVGETEETTPEDAAEIVIRNLNMKFKIAMDESNSLKEYMIRTVKGQNKYRILHALQDISLDIKKGEVVGIVGTNGSGKSTLLKIISGAQPQTSGTVMVDRSKVQLLTLGTGFDMELTARENVYLNGSLIGYDREYIDKNYEKIVQFAELEGFMEEKMKNFSSGMMSRLAFSIATMRDTPEILILDEVLSVGDLFFHQKSERKIQEMIQSGSTVLIVSHSPNVIRKNCTRAIWIEKGVLMADGKPDEVCTKYERMQME